MRHPALIAVCLLALLGTWNTQVQSAEPDNAEIVELRKLLQQSIERIASLEAQVAELKKEQPTSKPTIYPPTYSEPSDEETRPRQRKSSDLFRGPEDAQPRERNPKKDPLFSRRAPVKEPQPDEEARTAPGHTFSNQPLVTEPTPETRSPRLVPIPTPSQVVPEHWQRLEVSGKKFYLVPADEFPGRVSAERSPRYMRDE